ncbi:unnamed protein product [Durusdinium trenchii]|uniref:Uncharacterized protein n=1 Tax=Durusdinium trenchii TaxID=1381693 RepID=A0ABP0LY72_9DINO
MSRLVGLGGKGGKLTWHWSRYFRKLVGCLLIFFLMLAAVANCAAATPPNFILAGRPAFARRHVLRTPLQVRERLGSMSRSNQPDDSKGEVRRLNSRIKGATSENELIGILDGKVDATFLDPIHASTAYHKLEGFAQVKGSLQPGCANSPALERLQARTKDFIKQKQMQSWAFANLFWAMPILLDALPTVTELIPDMVKLFPARARSMNGQDLSNSLLL